MKMNAVFVTLQCNPNRRISLVPCLILSTRDVALSAINKVFPSYNTKKGKPLVKEIDQNDYLNIA